jgi:SARP family transcriptional regulator, regulator of embCAB operon
MSTPPFWRNLGESMAPLPVRIQVCGRIAVETAGVRRELELPGRQGRLLFTYLVIHRHHAVSLDELTDALWDATPPTASLAALHAPLSKLRRLIGCCVEHRTARLELPPDTWVDLDASRDAIHRAESATAQQDWARAWGAAQTALFISRRGFLPGETVRWADAIRHELDLLRAQSLETYANAALHIGHAELATAERASRELVELAPFRESAHRLLMTTLAERGNTAEAVRAYTALRIQLLDELGVSPSRETQELYMTLINRHP